MAARPVRSISAKSSYKALPPGADVLMLAPFVVSLRMPFMMWELATPYFDRHRDSPEGRRAVIEKTAAIMESYGSINAELMQSWTRIWLGAMAGDVPDARIISRAFQDVVDAGMEPAAKRVRANYRRLRKLSDKKSA
ncbi:MAG: hypothetical protein AAFR39_01520 [Pseudomonadota bacterium]